MEAAVLEEITAYAARRIGGSSLPALALVKKAARLYPPAVKALQRDGGSSRRFWEALGELSLVLDSILHSFPGDADYYFGVRQWDELLLPALRAVHVPSGRGMPPLHSQLCEVGDLVIHCNCEALSAEQQRQGAAELCRMLELAARGPEEFFPTMRYCVISCIGKLMFMTTRRENNGNDFARLADQGVAAEVAQRGLLKAALCMLGDPSGAMGMEGMTPTNPGPGSRDEDEAHIVQVAQCMVGALLLRGDTSTVATVARWAAGQAYLMRRLLEKLRRNPAWPQHAHTVLPAVRLLSQLSSCSPPLLEAAERGGLRETLQWLETVGDPECRVEVSGWIDLLCTAPPAERARLAATWQRFKNQALALASGATPGAAAPGAGMAAGDGGAGGQPSSGIGDSSSGGQSAGRQAQAGPALSREQLQALPVKELKQRLAAAGIDSSRCVGKEELVDLLADAMPTSAPSSAQAAPNNAGSGGSRGAGSGDEAEPEGQGDQPGEGGPSGAAAAAAAEGAARPAKCCACCGAVRAEGVKLRLCGGCRTPGLYYCSDSCQRQMWPSHKAACKAAKQQQEQQQQQQA